tara:strand:+ start:515 stop:769 length:255 start_codon:yes stop_codon:yes gene_type:complete
MPEKEKEEALKHYLWRIRSILNGMTDKEKELSPEAQSELKKGIESVLNIDGIEKFFCGSVCLQTSTQKKTATIFCLLNTESCEN